MTDHDEVDTVTDFCTEISRILTVRTVHTGQTIKNDEWIHCKKGNAFVDSVDPDKRYLSKRRYITKAKFDVYFSVRTAAEQFVERQNLLKNIPWEKYLLIQDSFKKFEDL